MDVKLISDLRNTPIPPGFVDRVVKSPPNAPNAPPIAVTLAEPNGVWKIEGHPLRFEPKRRRRRGVMSEVYIIFS